jgi:hypothetical protein
MTGTVRITFPNPGEALHQSYWQTIRRDSEGRMIAASSPSSRTDYFGTTVASPETGPGGALRYGPALSTI